MFGKVILSLVVATCIFLVHSSVESMGQKPAPQVKSASTIVTSFQVEEGLPDTNDILKLVNQARSNKGLEPLKANEKLAAVAQARARDMAINNYYAHKSLTGKFYYDIFDKLGFETDYSCENLDLAFTIESSQYINDWLNSSKGHRECLLNANVTDAGYAAIRHNDVPYNGRTAPSYIVVALHAMPLDSL